MSKFNKNQLSSRRGFLALGSASLATALTFTGRTASTPAKSGNPWSYDDSEFRKTDPKLIRFQETRLFEVLHGSPRCVCLTPDEHLLVGAGKFVTEYTLDGKRLTEFEVPQEVRCLASSAGDLIYVGTRDHVEVYHRDGARSASWPSPGQKAYLTALAVSADDVFVADAGNRIVWRCDTAGKIKRGSADAIRKRSRD